MAEGGECSAGWGWGSASVSGATRERDPDGPDRKPFATAEDRPILLEAIGVATVALLLSVALWRSIPKFGRVVLGVCGVMNLWTLFDACRRLLA